MSTTTHPILRRIQKAEEKTGARTRTEPITDLYPVQQYETYRHHLRMICATHTAEQVAQYTSAAYRAEFGQNPNLIQIVRPNYFAGVALHHEDTTVAITIEAKDPHTSLTTIQESEAFHVHTFHPTANHQGKLQALEWAFHLASCAVTSKLTGSQLNDELTRLTHLFQGRR